jgi:hypothetical protein
LPDGPYPSAGGMLSSKRVPSRLPTRVLSKPGITVPVPTTNPVGAPRENELSKTLGWLPTLVGQISPRSLVITVSPEATGVPLPGTRVCSMSCWGGWLAGKVSVGLVLNDPVTVIPVLPTTGASVGVGELAVVVEVVGGGALDEGLDPADGEREPDEQALREITAVSSSASRVGPPRHRACTASPIDFHSVVKQAGAEPNRSTQISLLRCGLVVRSTGTEASPSGRALRGQDRTWRSGPRPSCPHFLIELRTYVLACRLDCDL